MKLLLRYLRPHHWVIWLTLFLAAVNQVFSMLDPAILQIIIDQHVTKIMTMAEGAERSAEMWSIVKWVGAAIGVAMVSRTAKAFQDYYVNTITQKVGAQIYNDGIRHSLELPYHVFEDQRSGETLGVLEKVRTDVEKLISNVINVVFTTLVGIGFVTWYAVNIHWAIAPAYLGMIPLLAVLNMVLSKRIKVVQRQIVNQTTALAGATTESLRNIELVKSLGLTTQEVKRLNDTTDKILILELKKVRYLRSLNFIQGTFVNLLRNCILILMMFLIVSGKIAIGEFLALFIYSFFIFGPLQQLGTIINIYRETEVSLENYQQLIDTPVEPRPANPKPLGRISTLSFTNVHFQHETATRPAVDGFSFKTRMGETVAFVGPSGSGKSTMVKLLVGLYRPQEGQIFYNDIASDRIDVEELRAQIGFVAQDTQLFSGSIRENMLFVQPDASDAQIMHVLEMAACQTLLDRADKGLDTVIGEGGVKVSGGEKQRLSIARALLRNPALLVFDEATSALDSLTEEEISETIRQVSRNEKHLTILIAHRLSTIMHADTIYVLEKGRLSESGTHEQLLSQHGLYFAMWRQQIGEGV